MFQSMILFVYILESVKTTPGTFKKIRKDFNVNIVILTEIINVY